jgi:hypothetical protein
LDYLRQHEEVAISELTSHRVIEGANPLEGAGGGAPASPAALVLNSPDPEPTNARPAPATKEPAVPLDGLAADLWFREQILNNLPAGVAVFSDKAQVVYTNETYGEIWRDTHGREPEKALTAIAAAIRDGTSEREMRIVVRPGKGGTVRLKLLRLAPANGHGAQLLVFATRVLADAAPKKPANRSSRAKKEVIAASTAGGSIGC